MAAFWSPLPDVGSNDWTGTARRSVVISAQAYSGTTSTQRIVTQLAAQGGYRVVSPGDEAWNAGTPERSAAFADYREFGEIYYWRLLNVCTESLSRSGIPAESLRFVVTFRDPRDAFVSEYNNAAFDHPLPPEPAHRRAFLAWREQVRTMGLDTFALSRIAPFREQFFAPLAELRQRIAPRAIVPLSYARLCLDLPGFLAGLLGALDMTAPSSLIDHLLRTENVKRPERMPYSACHFPKASPLPGRFRRELQPDTIERLNRELADILAWMSSADPAFADCYRP